MPKASPALGPLSRSRATEGEGHVSWDSKVNSCLELETDMSRVFREWHRAAWLSRTEAEGSREVQVPAATLCLTVGEAGAAARWQWTG